MPLRPCFYTTVFWVVVVHSHQPTIHSGVPTSQWPHPHPPIPLHSNAKCVRRRIVIAAILNYPAHGSHSHYIHFLFHLSDPDPVEYSSCRGSLKSPSTHLSPCWWVQEASLIKEVGYLCINIRSSIQGALDLVESLANISSIAEVEVIQ